jgi:hypothetical protein
MSTKQMTGSGRAQSNLLTIAGFLTACAAGLYFALKPHTGAQSGDTRAIAAGNLAAVDALLVDMTVR